MMCVAFVSLVVPHFVNGTVNEMSLMSVCLVYPQSTIPLVIVKCCSRRFGSAIRSNVTVMDSPEHEMVGLGTEMKTILQR